MCRLMGKPTICICETKTQISFAATAKLISAFVFATRIVQFLLYLTQKFKARSYFLCLYRPVCVGPVRKPHCWFSREAAHMSPMLPENSENVVRFFFFFFSQAHRLLTEAPYLLIDYSLSVTVNTTMPGPTTERFGARFYTNELKRCKKRF